MNYYILTRRPRMSLALYQRIEVMQESLLIFLREALFLTTSNLTQGIP